VRQRSLIPPCGGSNRIVFSPERESVPHCRRLGWPAPVSGQQLPAFLSVGRGFRAPGLCSLFSNFRFRGGETGSTVAGDRFGPDRGAGLTASVLSVTLAGSTRDRLRPLAGSRPRCGWCYLCLPRRGGPGNPCPCGLPNKGDYAAWHLPMTSRKRPSEAVGILRGIAGNEDDSAFRRLQRRPNGASFDARARLALAARSARGHRAEPRCWGRLFVYAVAY
jgi:hypothetical protein